MANLACRGLEILDDPNTLLQKFNQKGIIAIFIKKHSEKDSDFVEEFMIDGEKIKVPKGCTIMETARIIWEEVD
jgi:hypothetical protein